LSETNKYRNNTNSRYTKALFYEMTMSDKSTVLYTLKDEDHKSYPSLYRLYMDLDDLTEYEFANTYLDGWEHWQMLCDCEWFKPFVLRWREELELRTKAAALRAIKQEANEGTKNSYSANKVLLEGGWKKEAGKSVQSRGRPTKDEVNKEAKIEAEKRNQVIGDAKRLGL
jgi:hypothetical protein